MSKFSSSERPTLPPLHTLDLPIPFLQKPRLQGSHAMHDFYEPQSCPSLHVPHWRPVRQASGSSSMTSRTPSPSPPSPQSSPSPKFRLVPTTFEDATAIVLVPPPDAPYIPELTASVTCPLDGMRSKPLLLVGPSLRLLRHPSRQLAKGARIHPYRIVMNGHSTRRSLRPQMLSV